MDLDVNIRVKVVFWVLLRLEEVIDFTNTYFALVVLSCCDYCFYKYLNLISFHLEIVILIQYLQKYLSSFSLLFGYQVHVCNQAYRQPYLFSSENQLFIIALFSLNWLLLGVNDLNSNYLT